MTPIPHDTAHGQLALWRAMVDARAFDQAMSRHNNHWHEARGEEAAFIGGFSQLLEGDISAPHFRGACGVKLMQGVVSEELAAGVFGLSSSATGGHWRGDICPAPDTTSIGMYSGSLGTTVAYATGAALRLAQLRTGGAVLCAFGDGTANAGVVAESMNLAAMLALPIVYVCQNNQYATSLAASVALPGRTVADRASALGIPAKDVDGNDVIAVAGSVAEALANARDGSGPAFIHALTYRMGGHYMNDPETYRSSDEVSKWAAKDPVARLQRTLVDQDELDEKEASAYETRVIERMEAIVSKAKLAAAQDAPPSVAGAFAEQWGRPA